MRNPTAIALAGFVVLTSSWDGRASELDAPPDARRYAVTDLNRVGEDFAYQGEYTGAVADGTCGRLGSGLQIIARGNGEFEAVQYRGGLPGSGWDLQTRTAYTGDVQDGVLILHGEAGETIMTDGSYATVFGASGQELGQLRKNDRVSPTLGASSPPGAVILFDGQSTENLEEARVTVDGLLEVGATTKMPVRDFRLHIEFRLPYMPYATGQARGNSGVYIQRRYEVQILDSFGLEGLANECGSLYRQQPPDVNMCFPPLSWQTYDIWFRAARWNEAGEKTENARITVLHNGVAIHADREIPTKTGAGKPESPEPLPILLQNHGNPVHFRNAWIVLGEPTKARPVARKVVCRKRVRCRLLPRLVCRLRCRR
jgi:hypothetical protein